MLDKSGEDGQKLPSKKWSGLGTASAIGLF
jgi:hypothetical protein